MIDRITQARLDDGRSHAAVNRTLALVRSILRNYEREWQWLDKAPAIHLLEEPTRRARYLTRDEAGRLLSELPEHLRDLVAFSLASGRRAANLTCRRWSAVDMARRLAWVHPDEAKARKANPVPLGGEGMAILQEQIGKHPVIVFTFRGRQVEQPSTAAWYNAMRQSGIENFRLHDLRHTWASRHVQGGTPLNVLHELGGWSSFTLVQRHAHLAAGHLSRCADRLKAIDTNRDQDRGPNPSQSHGLAGQINGPRIASC